MLPSLNDFPFCIDLFYPRPGCEPQVRNCGRNVKGAEKDGSDGNDDGRIFGVNIFLPSRRFL